MVCNNWWVPAKSFSSLKMYTKLFYNESDAHVERVAYHAQKSLLILPFLVLRYLYLLAVARSFNSSYISCPITVAGSHACQDNLFFIYQNHANIMQHSCTWITQQKVRLRQSRIGGHSITLHANLVWSHAAFRQKQNKVLYENCVP